MSPTIFLIQLIIIYCISLYHIIYTNVFVVVSLLFYFNLFIYYISHFIHLLEVYLCKIIHLSEVK